MMVFLARIGAPVRGFLEFLGDQAHLVTDSWLTEGRAWDWTNRIVYLPKSP